MSTNITKLKRSKGAPPAIDAAPDVIAEDKRREKVELKPLQVRIPKTVFEEFSERAGREFGFSHGSKKQLFLKMWKSYQKQSM